MLLAVPFAGAQVIGVQPTPLGMYQWDSSSVAWDKLPNSYSLFPSENTPQPFAFYGWNSLLSEWTPCDKVTNSCPWLGGSSSGCVGTITVDNTSTNCGFGNLTGATTTPPANVEVYGYMNSVNNGTTTLEVFGSNNGAGASGDHIAMFGSDSGANMSGTQIVLMGSSLATGSTMGQLVAIGSTNASYSSDTDGVVIGDNNGIGTPSAACSLKRTVLIGDHQQQNCPKFTGGIVGIGTQNFNLPSPNTLSFGDVVAIGASNVIYSAAGSGGALSTTVAIGNNNVAGLGGNTYDLVAVGDLNIQGDPTTPHLLHDVIGIGDASGDAPDGSNNVVAIGNNSGDISGLYTGGQTTTYGVFLGTNSGGALGHDIVIIGEEAMTGVPSSTPSDVNDVIAIGNTVLACDSTGSDIVAIGDFVGSIGYAGVGSCGNSNTTGSHNVWIGDTSGPNTTSQLDDTVAIGFNSYVTESHSARLGGTTTAKSILSGVEMPGTLYSAAGTALPSCSASFQGGTAKVSDATSPTYMGAYVSGGAITAEVICSFNGSSYAWLTH